MKVTLDPTATSPVLESTFLPLNVTQPPPTVRANEKTFENPYRPDTSLLR